MIPKLTQSIIYSTLGNNSSKVPLAIKDIANSCGLTGASYLAGDKNEGQDRFIDEFGTQAIWLWGIPAYQFVLDKIMFKPAGIDPKVDVRILKNKEILKSAIENAPNDTIKNSLIKASNNVNKVKALTIAKFAASTLLTIGSYFGLTKFRHKYTEDQIKKDYFAKQEQEKEQNKDINAKQGQVSFAGLKKDDSKQQNNSISFKGGLEDFIFDPVKNLMIVDASITGERLSKSRNPQDFLGYVIKEGSFWAFMYLAGPLLSKAFEARADKMGKSIDLDARVIFADELKNAFKNGSIQKHIAEFNKNAKTDVELYNFAVNDKKNLVIDTAKKSDIIELYGDSGKVDTRKYINLDELRATNKKIEKLYKQYQEFAQSGEHDINDFFKAVRKLKKGAILKNIGACIGALGIIAPAIMLISRKFGSETEYQVKKDIEEKLAKENQK